MHGDILFHRPPFSLFIPDSLTGGADGQQSPEYLVLGFQDFLVAQGCFEFSQQLLPFFFNRVLPGDIPQDAEQLRFFIISSVV